MGNIAKLRRLKHGDPKKFKVLAEDLRRDRGSAGVSWTTFAIVVAGASALAFAATLLIGAFY